jgi:hypothetical protein
VAATVPVENAGDVNPLMESAKLIGSTQDDEAEEKKTSPAEPDVGSFERFMMSFGSPHRWAGR